MLLWTVSIMIGVIALIGVLLVPGRTRIEQNDDLEGYERRWKFIVYIIGFMVIGGAAFLVLELLVLKALEAGELWAKIDMGLFTALGLGIIVYNTYTAKLIAKMREEESVEELGVTEEAQVEGAVMTKKVTKTGRTVKSAALDRKDTECPACGEPFMVGVKECDSCGAEFEYDDGGHEGAVMTERVTEVEEVEAHEETDAFECPSCSTENRVGDKNCSGCRAEFDYE